MNSSEHHSLHIMWFFALFIKCPLGEATDDCPFSDIRDLQSLELKFHLAETLVLNSGDHENLRNTHEECFRRRRNRLLGITQTSEPVLQRERAA